MRKYLVLALFLCTTLLMSSCFMFRHRSKPQYRQAPPTRISNTSYNRTKVRTRTKGRNYKNQYRSDYKGFRKGRDPYHYRGNRYQY